MKMTFKHEFNLPPSILSFPELFLRTHFSPFAFKCHTVLICSTLPPSWTCKKNLPLDVNKPIFYQWIKSLILILYLWIKVTVLFWFLSRPHHHKTLHLSNGIKTSTFSRTGTMVHATEAHVFKANVFVGWLLLNL